MRRPAAWPLRIAGRAAICVVAGVLIAHEVWGSLRVLERREREAYRQKGGR